MLRIKPSICHKRALVVLINCDRAKPEVFFVLCLKRHINTRRRRLSGITCNWVIRQEHPQPLCGRTCCSLLYISIFKCLRGVYGSPPEAWIHHDFINDWPAICCTLNLEGRSRVLPHSNPVPSSPLTSGFWRSVKGNFLVLKLRRAPLLLCLVSLLHLVRHPWHAHCFRSKEGPIGEPMFSVNAAILCVNFKSLQVENVLFFVLSDFSFCFGGKYPTCTTTA